MPIHKSLMKAACVRIAAFYLLSSAFMFFILAFAASYPEAKTVTPLSAHFLAYIGFFIFYITVELTLLFKKTSTLLGYVFFIILLALEFKFLSPIATFLHHQQRGFMAHNIVTIAWKKRFVIFICSWIAVGLGLFLITLSRDDIGASYLLLGIFFLPLSAIFWGLLDWLLLRRVKNKKTSHQFLVIFLCALILYFPTLFIGLRILKNT